MKKERIFILLIMLLIINLSFAFAAENTTVSEKAYDCIEAKVENKCSSIAPEEKIFALLALRSCKAELLADAINEECWPKSGCKIKTTAQAMLALREVNSDVNKSTDWLLSKKAPTTQIDWLLQIESSKPASCQIAYSGNSYNIKINEDKTIDSPAGSCLSLYEDDYWLKVSTTCYGKDFEITCNESFVTSLLYKEQDSSTVYVSEQTQSSSADGTTKEAVNSFCFREGTSCDYEGTLWASLILNKLKLDISPYMPYLVSMAEENEKYLPESFLYILLGESYRNEILLKQQEDQWWLASGDKFYDTAVALYPFQYEELREKTSTIVWLEEIQGTDGCWQGNLRNTAFLLYSIWPKKSSETSTTGEVDCEEAGHYCLSTPNCEDAGGEEMKAYSGCFGSTICCNKQLTVKTCLGLGGEKCSSEQTCSGGKEVSASDLNSDEMCCVDGECKTPETSSEGKSACEKYGGSCKSACLSGEQETQYTCPGSETCCLEKTKKSYAAIIIFSILIVLVVLGIVFRNRLKLLFDKITKKKTGTGTSSTFGQPPSSFGPGSLPPSTPPGIPQRMIPRRIIPTQPARPAPRRPQGEFSEVLKKLKEMGGGSSRPADKKEVVVRSHVRRINK